MTACGRRWTIHPAAQVFPLIEGTALEQLVADIRTNGLREPLTLHPDGSVLDGRNRLKACDLAKVTPVTRTWNAKGSAIAYVVSLNLHRRHLDESQRAIVAAKIANLSDGQRKSGSPIGEARVSQQDAADLLSVGKRSVERARKVIERGEPALVQAVERGDISVSVATQATTLAPREQQAVVARVDAGERPADVIREIRAERTREGEPAKGRPPRVALEPTERLVIYVTKPEKDAIEGAATANHQSMSEFGRVSLCEAAAECGYDVPETLERRAGGERRQQRRDLPAELERRKGPRRQG